MPILTPARLKNICPEFAGIDDAKLVSAILRAQTIAESALGSDRPLERAEYKENKRLEEGSQTCYLDLLPVDLEANFIVEARFGAGYYHRTKGTALSPSAFTTLDPNSYFFNEITGELNLHNYFTNPVFNAFNRSFPVFQHGYTELNVTYTGGYDFESAGDDDPGDREMEEIQVLLSEVVKYIGKGFFTGEGIKAKSVDNWYKMEYVNNASSVPIGSIPATLLAPFKKFGRNLNEF